MTRTYGVCKFRRWSGKVFRPVFRVRGFPAMMLVTPYLVYKTRIYRTGDINILVITYYYYYYCCYYNYYDLSCVWSIDLCSQSIMCAFALY